MGQRGNDIDIESGVTSRVVAVIAEVLAVDAQSIRLDSSLIDDLGAASLDLVQLLWNLEEEFGKPIPDEDVDTFHTPRDVVAYIVRKLGEQDGDEA